MNLAPITEESLPQEHTPCRLGRLPQNQVSDPGLGAGTAGFPTALGPCQLSWTPVGVSRFEFGASEPKPDTPPPWVRAVICRIVAHLSGALDPLDDVPLDLPQLTPFRREVMEATRRIQPGATLTYGQLAEQVGKPGAARAVGTVMSRNPIPLIVPCHRVRRGNGGLGGFSAPGGVGLKERLLRVEGAVS